MKNVKFLFLSLFMAAFLAPTLADAQATVEWIDGDIFEIVDNYTTWTCDFNSIIKHKVTHTNGMINYIAWGTIECELPVGIYTDYQDPNVRVKLFVYAGGYFKIHIKVKKETPPDDEE